MPNTMTAEPVSVQKDADKLWVINIALGNDGEPRDQFINANGREFLISRGKNVTVPKSVLNVLDQCIIGVYEVNQNDAQKSIFVDRLKYPYTVIGPA